MLDVAAISDPSAAEVTLDPTRARLLAELGDRRPYFYPFKRILMWGRMAA